MSNFKPSGGAILNPIRQVKTGFFAPVEALRFLSKNPALYVMGLAPHILGFIAYFWLVQKFAVQAMLNYLIVNEAANWSVTLARVSVYLIALFLYSPLFLPIVNLISNPLQDVIATKTYERASGQKLADQTFSFVIRSFGTEVIKIFVLVALFFAGWIFPFASPVLVLVSILYFGWDFADRTLALQGKSMSQRFLFGAQNPFLCFSLGIWVYIPLVGSVFAFVMATAAALAVAKTEESPTGP